MRRIVIAATAIALIFGSLAAAYAEAQLTKEQKIVGNILNQYATIAGGWYLEKKCEFMSEDIRKEWETDITSCTVRLNKNLGVSEKMLHQIQAAGKSAADTKTCNNSTRDIVVHTVLMAKKLSAALKKLDKKPGEEK